MDKHCPPPHCREQPPAASSQVRFIPQEGQDPPGPNPSSGGHQQQALCRPSCQEGACWEDSKRPGKLRTRNTQEGLPRSCVGNAQRTGGGLWDSGLGARRRKGAGRRMVLKGLNFAVLRKREPPSFLPPGIYPKWGLLRKKEVGCLPITPSHQGPGDTRPAGLGLKVLDEV